MTYVYGATLRGTSKHIEGYVAYEMDGVKFPSEMESYLYCQYAARKLFTGIAAAVPAADFAMKWLRGVAQQNPNGKPMEWRTPAGFLVQHDYPDKVESRITLRSCGLVHTRIKENADGTNNRQMQNAISPNFVHALDATHLLFTALRMQAAGLQMVGIHDSFGTHPCDVSEMHTHIREAFVSMYKNRNVLAEFLWDVQGVGETPIRGNLDLDCVLDSEFFFC